MKKSLLLSFLAILVVGFGFLGNRIITNAQSEYLDEFKDAYNWAHSLSITTQPSIDKANMDGNITRAEMAKMVSNYAKNSLGKKFDTSKACLFINSNIVPDLVTSVTESCQLGLMGQGVSDFRPNDNVTRAEFGTVLSRLLFNLKDGDPYYSTHLAKLKAEGIISNDDPNLQEKRGYVMLMLMRSAKTIDNLKPDLTVNTETMENSTINLKIGNEILTVELEDNSSTKAFVEKLKKGDIIINAHEYGNFEKVGELGFDLPREDKQITTEAGDIVLYNGNQISLFYDSNSWSYTKLGKVQNKSQSELKKILGDGDITLTFSLETFKIAEETNKSLILVFSPTGNTKRIATFINEITESDLVELIPEIPYTAEDLDYNTKDTRANNEQNDPDARPEITTEFSLDGYDRIYIGYPIWWGTNPKIILTLIEKYDFSGKEVVLFCTSGSSGIETSENELKSHELNIIGSKRFDQGATKEEVQEWLESL